MKELSSVELQEILRIFVDSDLRQMHLQVGNLQLIVSKEETTPTLASASIIHPPSDMRVASEEQKAPDLPPETPATVIESSQTGGAVGMKERPGLLAIPSPLLGVFYRRPAPDKSPYVEVGDKVKPDTPVCTISVMKMFTEVLAGHEGRVAELLVEDDSLVEQGQILMFLEPTQT